MCIAQILPFGQNDRVSLVILSGAESWPKTWRSVKDLFHFLFENGIIRTTVASLMHMKSPLRQRIRRKGLSLWGCGSDWLPPLAS